MGCCQSRQQRQRPGSTDHGNAADARRSSVAAYVQDQHGAIDNGRSAHPNAARQASRSSATAQLPSQTPITGAATTNGTAPETPGTLSPLKLRLRRQCTQ
ncbi:hypothetical protein KEM55_008694 [Ascosphaera atra]|nr:hypothetical protein KEM55_008694 [Ascosphaera atra]